MKGRYYLAGPMTGIPELNFPLFHNTADKLRAEGYDIVNPAEINTDPNAKWVDCMRADIAQLVTCEGVFMLPGWEKSRGATVEHGLAITLEMNVVYLTEEVTA